MLTRLRSQRGASAIEMAIYTPIMFFVIFLTIQFALHYHGGQVAHAAAREGARIARQSGGDLAAAQTRAAEYAAAVGGGQLTDVEVDAVNVDGTYVRVEVCGRAKEIIKDITPRVCRHAEGPIEEFRPDL
ncbi:TadE/TadG family type IV pilus assembly protein [Phytoactinopolyspora halotolerans]|uniref:Pilus assembly protein n=1 Tax=Phytoactinopolyspora halotolerans TaxID=1981512 RepID=A0A6L9SE48_9ACTN|nr:TadE family protein [Phytoactinopolyspora halotolerans]NEE02781.1 pilus assembly protein [Phytoactinopolyspora halotolerans]